MEASSAGVGSFPKNNAADHHTHSGGGRSLHFTLCVPTGSYLSSCNYKVSKQQQSPSFNYEAEALHRVA